jgi:hypothetical protein
VIPGVVIKEVTSNLKLNSVILLLNYVLVITDIMIMEFKFVNNVVHNAKLVIEMVVSFVPQVESTHLSATALLVNSLMPTTSVNHVPINVTIVSILPTTV